MNKQHRESRNVRKSIWIALALMLIVGFVLRHATGSTHLSLSMETDATTATPPVELHGGSAENSTSIVYTNRTSAKVTVEGEGDFNYVLNFSEQDETDWKIRLNAYDQSNISRLSNCSIYIYGGVNSTQIVISNGEYTNRTGPWYNLSASTTECIWMHVEESASGTSNVNTYLEILVPNTKVYARYIVEFEIT
ncbi:MAG: hypothetical protein JSW72_05800 [Candidatus Bathyarchaeota archaeon]|nr:MAG: hypothetical protein JSW72_05800 [Candidatus Bathyarchaeota archaeon]